MYKHGPITGPLDYEWEARTISKRPTSSSSAQGRTDRHSNHTGAGSIPSIVTSGSDNKGEVGEKKQQDKKIKVNVRACRCGAVIHALLPACAACVSVAGLRGYTSTRGGRQSRNDTGRVGGHSGGRLMGRSGRGRNVNLNLKESNAAADELAASVSRLSVGDRKSRH